MAGKRKRRIVYVAEARPNEFGSMTTRKYFAVKGCKKGNTRPLKGPTRSCKTIKGHTIPQ